STTVCDQLGSPTLSVATSSAPWPTLGCAAAGSASDSAAPASRTAPSARLRRSRRSAATGACSARVSFAFMAPSYKLGARLVPVRGRAIIARPAGGAEPLRRPPNRRCLRPRARARDGETPESREPVDAHAARVGAAYGDLAVVAA